MGHESPQDTPSADSGSSGVSGSQPSTLNSQPPSVPDHQLLKKIGSGSYGDVWLARNVLGEFRAVKVVYRDIKPSNIIFVGGVPKLADIGLVASMDKTMSFVGTSGFLPPEGPGTPQADIYSLGKVLYEISTGRDRQDFPKLPPELLQGGSSRREEAPSEKAESRKQKAEIDQSLLTSAAKRLLELNAVILKACAHDPRQRYQSAKEMAADLALLQRGQSVKRKRALQRRFDLAQTLGLAVAAVILLAAAVWLLSTHFNGSSAQRFNAAVPEINSTLRPGSFVSPMARPSGRRPLTARSGTSAPSRARWSGKWRATWIFPSTIRRCTGWKRISFENWPRTNSTARRAPFRTQARMHSTSVSNCTIAL